MSTRSGIGYVTEDGKVKSVYCHYDGYPEGVGYRLIYSHNNIEDAKAIVALGSLSYLEKRLNPIGSHSFGHPEDGTTVAYHRDRGEDLEIEEWANLKDYLSEAGDFYGAEYLYYFIGDDWHCFNIYTGEEEAI